MVAVDIFGNFGRIATEDVALHLYPLCYMVSKPVHSKKQVYSLDFVVNRFHKHILVARVYKFSFIAYCFFHMYALRM